mmetsp:Transcript_45230/g.106740  ORF Transcript_45230/g.106740 Transcript_45230/m.106740 type:complete len:249 (-) Transcript_45230:1660-2406(-)
MFQLSSQRLHCPRRQCADRDRRPVATWSRDGGGPPSTPPHATCRHRRHSDHCVCRWHLPWPAAGQERCDRLPRPSRQVLQRQDPGTSDPPRRDGPQPAVPRRPNHCNTAHSPPGPLCHAVPRAHHTANPLCSVGVLHLDHVFQRSALRPSPIQHRRHHHRHLRRDHCTSGSVPFHASLQGARPALPRQAKGSWLEQGRCVQVPQPPWPRHGVRRERCGDQGCPAHHPSHGQRLRSNRVQVSQGTDLTS